MVQISKYIYVVELLFQIYIFQQHFNNTDDTYTSYGEVTGKIFITLYFLHHKSHWNKNN